jgi:hypothetical protein
LGKTLRAFSIPAAVIALACVTSPAAAGQEAAAAADARTDRLASFRPDFNKLLDRYDVVFRKIGNARGLRVTASARESLRAVSDDQLAKLFAKVRVPDLSAALQAAEKLEALAPAAGSGAPRAVETPGFPNAPPILEQCHSIAHSSGFTFGALVAWQVLRTVLAAAEFACEETLVVAGEGGNAAGACIPLAIAQDAAAIPYELASFCGGEEDSALAQGTYDRLEHIHNDIEAARVQIITEMRSLSCDLERLLHTPEGQRQSSVSECTGQPYFPYDFPIHYPHP